MRIKQPVIIFLDTIQAGEAIRKLIIKVNKVSLQSQWRINWTAGKCSITLIVNNHCENWRFSESDNQTFVIKAMKRKPFPFELNRANSITNRYLKDFPLSIGFKELTYQSGYRAQF